MADDESDRVAAPAATEAPTDLGATMRELADRETLVKAYVLGSDRVTASNALPWVDVAEREQVFAGMGAIQPPYDPETLCVLFENSSALRQNVDAYATNIDAFGHRFEPIIDLDAADVDDRIANALAVERARQQPHADAAPPTPDEVATKKREITWLMRVEHAQLKTFFDFCCVDFSFVTLRRQTRQDIEVTGNGYWEALRDGGGDVVQFVYLPAFTVRLLPLDMELVEDDLKVKVTELSYDTLKMKRRFRRYIQFFEGNLVFFKQFGDRRVISRKTGQVFPTVDALLAADKTDGPATELLHFKLHSPRSAYGVPRWIGNLLAVLGSRQAEEVNFLYFENKSVPPLALLVSGGRLSAQSVPRIESFIDTHIKGKRNFHKILVLEAESSSGGHGLEHTGRVKIELRPLTDAQQQDHLFGEYDERNADKVGQSFRLPRMLRGDIRDFNKSTADAALSFAESQVFQPERHEFDDTLNRKILAELGIRFWHFRSNSPVTRDPATMADIIRNLTNAYVLTPEEARALASDVFNRELKKIDANWVKQPVALTLAGLEPSQAAPKLPEPDVKKDLATRDLARDGGALRPAQGSPRREPAGTFDLEAEARRLLALRAALRAAEAEAAARTFTETKRAELEREVVYVPAAELASWLEPEAPRSTAQP